MGGHEEVPEEGYKAPPTDNNPTRGEPTDEEVREALGDDYDTVGNAHLITDVREELARVDTSEFDSSECEAFGDVIQGLAYLQESLSEPERRPNAKVEPWGEPDD